MNRVVEAVLLGEGSTARGICAGRMENGGGQDGVARLWALRNA